MGHSHLPQDRRPLIDKEANTKNAAAQLGHATEHVTKKHYVEKPALAPDSSDIHERLGGGRTTPESERRDQGPRQAA
jgi:hypothetical protein